MKSLSRLSILLFAALAVSPCLAATLYSVTAVAGPNSNAHAINGLGDVTGGFQTSGGPNHAFLYVQPHANRSTPPPGFHDLGTLAGGESVGRDVNNSLNVVGQSDGRAFRYTGLGPAPGMVALSAGPSNARGLNDFNKAIGSVQGVVNTTTIWLGNNFPTSYFATEDTEGYGINNFGEHVGRVDGTTGYYSDGTSNSAYTDLGLFLPNAIGRNSLTVAGSENGVATIYKAGLETFLTLGKLNPTDLYSDALGLNNLTHVVGISEGTGGFLWTEADGMKNLTSLLASGYEGWTVLSANGINDKGWIAGLGELDGQQYAIILAPVLPVPEPGTAFLLGLGILTAAILRRLGSQTWRLADRTRGLRNAPKKGNDIFDSVTGMG